MKVPSAWRLNHEWRQLAYANSRDDELFYYLRVLQSLAKFRVDTRAIFSRLPVLVAVD